MGHHGHDHTAAARDGNRRALAVVLALTASFTVVEIIGGILTPTTGYVDVARSIADGRAHGLGNLGAGLRTSRELELADAA